MSIQSALAFYHLPENLFSDNATLIATVRNGLTGQVVKAFVTQHPEQRDNLTQVLGTSKGNLHRFYRKAKLAPNHTEEILDIIRVHAYAEDVFQDPTLAKQWMDMPIPALDNTVPNDLLDTFAGRKLVTEALERIEYGEFA